ncbi:hypothetical protein ACTA71_002939 [Dictyostelium dimigraforme]
MEKEKFTSHEGLRQQVEYSKSSRSSCKKCKGTIPVDTIRIGVETPSRVFDGYDIKYYHLNCTDFPKLKVFYINQLKHYELLRWDDQLNIRKVLGQSDDGLNLALATYYNEVWRIKDILIKELKPPIIKKLFLEFYPKLDSLSPSYYLHFLADGLSYGRIGPCPSCNGLTVSYDGKNYYCRGFSSSFSRCTWHGEEVKRYRFLIPKELMPKTTFFKGYTFSQIHPYEVLEYKETKGINSTKETEIPIFSALSISDSNDIISNNNNNNIICNMEINNNLFYRKSPIKNNSILLKVDSSFIHNGGKILVMEDSVFGYVAYNVLMNLTDLIHNNNSYYILQIIQVGTTYWVFSKWGRIGVSNGGTMNHSHSSLKYALEEFCERFLDKTGVNWNDRSNYKKQNGKYAIIDLEESSGEFGGLEEETTTTTTLITPVNTNPSKLLQPVQSLVNILFDSELMKKSLTSLQFDVQKMPLGKISQNQVNQAYAVLNRIQELLETIEKQSPLQPLSPTAQHNIKSEIIVESSRFYTYIPHRFEGGLMSKIPPIDNKEILVKCIRLVDTLGEIEVVNQLKRLSTSTSGNSTDDNYNLLKADIKPLEKDSRLFQNIKEFALSTVDPNLGFTVDILDIFKVDRTGVDDEQLFTQQWAESIYNNRMLLFHGSRIQSWCTILPNGLKIASPLSPKSGYRLGKGVYLADCISVSCLYTGATKENSTAIVAICDVALGNSAALYHDTYMEEAQLGYQSTKAFGKRQPALYDQLNGCYQDKDEFIPSSILKGPIIETGSVVTSFTHNEYVIYNNSQCRIKYLLKLKLNFN